MSTFDTLVRLIYLLAAVLFVRGLHQMNSPVTARRGNLVSASGMVLAVLTTAVVLVRDGDSTLPATAVLVLGLVVGSAAGLAGARTVKMTDMPQLVSLFNAVGGGAAALVAIVDATGRSTELARLSTDTALATALDVVIGAITFSGSLVAASKLQGLLPGRPLSFRGSRLVSLLLAVLAVGSGVLLVTGHLAGIALIVAALSAIGLGLLLVLPIGGADMPVVISLLNAATGTAVAMAGFVIDNTMLITAGALVGASGSILTLLMARAMNRSLANIVLGGFGSDDSTGTTMAGADLPVRSVSADDVAVQLAYARSVVIVPGYGLAAAQAQHELVDLASALGARGVAVSYAIHPVAGRMPGHMNVLLAEAHVPYEQMKDLDQGNQLLPHTDVALVVGANDVVNPAARIPGSAVAGMPILDVDKAAGVVVIKRSMGHGYAGIDNPLFTDPKTGMFFSDAKSGLAALSGAVSALVG
jgi:NAD(P) transhydrogenase subunit beta